MPLAAVTTVWLALSLPSMPAGERVPAGRVLALLRRPHVARAMSGVMVSFGDAFTAFTYFRPFLENHVHATVPQLSLLLLVDKRLGALALLYKSDKVGLQAVTFKNQY